MTDEDWSWCVDDSCSQCGGQEWHQLARADRAIAYICPDCGHIWVVRTAKKKRTRNRYPYYAGTVDVRGGYERQGSEQ